MHLKIYHSFILEKKKLILKSFSLLFAKKIIYSLLKQFFGNFNLLIDIRAYPFKQNSLYIYSHQINIHVSLGTFVESNS